jgi:hypothetical protein
MATVLGPSQPGLRASPRLGTSNKATILNRSVGYNEPKRKTC